MDYTFYKTIDVLNEFEKIIHHPSEICNEAVKSHFTKFIILQLYAELEEKLFVIYKEFFYAHSDTYLSEFLANNFKGIFQRTDKKDLRKTIKMLSKEERFNSNKISEKEFETYSGFIQQRNNIAHGIVN